MLAQRIVGHRHVNLRSTRPALFRLRNRGGPLLVTLLWLLLISASACTQGEPRKAGERAKVEPVPPATTVAQRELDEQPSLDGDECILMELPVCVGIKKPEKCKRGAVLFTQKCNLCHYFPSVRERSGPTLVGLVGRERRFLNGQSLVADRNYIRRSIVDHNSDDEYVPGYDGTFEKSRMLGHPEASMRAALRRVEANAWDATVGRLDRDDVDALVAFIEWLSPGAWPQGSVKVAGIVPGKAPFDAGCIRKQIELRLESIHVSYEILLEGQSDLDGEVTVQFMGLPGGSLADGKVLHDTVGHPILARCVADAVGDATASCPVPPTDGTVTFAFARDEDAREPPIRVNDFETPGSRV